MTQYLIQNARVLGGEPTDLLLRDGVIEAVGAGLTAGSAEVWDAADRAHLILHAGDVVTGSLLDDLAARAPLRAVLGNNDAGLEHRDLKEANVLAVGPADAPRFVLLDFAGGCIWIFSLTLAGYWFGNLPIVKDNLTVVILGIIALSLAPLAWAWLRQRLAARGRVEQGGS